MGDLMTLQELAGVHGDIRIWRLYQGGSELSQEFPNIVVNTGLAMLVQNIGASGGVVNYYAWGSSGIIAGSVVAKQAASSGLNVQDGSRAIDSIVKTNNTITFICTIPTTDGNSPGTINEFMVGISGTTINPFAMQAFNNEPKDNTFSLQFEHSITFTSV